MNLNMNFLADIPISPAELFSCLGIVLFGMGAYALLLRIQVDRKKLAAGTPQADIRPSPLVVKRAEEFVAREECQHTVATLSRRIEILEERFEEITAEMKKDSNRLSQEGDARSRRLHERIEAVSNSLGHEIAAMPERIINLLRSTGAIGRK